MTYVRTWQGWAYLATVIDLASRRVVGWALADHMEASLVCDAMCMAIVQPAAGRLAVPLRPGQPGTPPAEFRALLAANGITQSLSRPGQCWDNSVAEAWFGTYKLELIDDRTWPTVAALRSATFKYIEIWYNQTRRHSSIHYFSPAAYGTQLIHQHRAAHAA